MSTENTQSLTGPTLDPLGSDGRPLSDHYTEIVERLRRLEAVSLAPQTIGQKSIAQEKKPEAKVSKENEPEAKAAKEDKNVDIKELSTNITILISNFSMLKWFVGLILIIIGWGGVALVFFMVNVVNDNIKSLSNRMDDNFKILSNRMDGLSNRMDGLSNRVDGLSNKIGDNFKTLSNMINENEKASISRIDSINSILSVRIDDLMKMLSEIKAARVRKLGESTRPASVKDQTPSPFSRSSEELN
jgi:hypothetical protein